MRRIAWSALVAIVAATLMQAIRVVFPLLYDVREDAGASTAVLWALGAFVVGPLVLAGVAGRAPTGFRLAVLALAGARLALQFLHPIPVWLGAAAVAIGLTALLLVVIAARSGGHGGDAGIAIVAGLGLDAAILGVFETWDPVWQDGIAAVSVGVAMALATAVAAAARPEPAGGSLDAWPMVLLAPFLLVHVLFVQNVAFATSETGAPIAGGAAFVLLGSVLGVLAATILVPRAHGVPHVAAGVVLVASVGVLALVQGPNVAVAQPVAGAAAGAVLTLALCAPAHEGHASGAGPHLLWSVLGAGLFVGAAFAYQIDIDVPLPVPRAAWPLAAAIVLASASVRRHRPAAVSAAPAVVPVIGAVLVPLLLAVDLGSSPDPTTFGGTYRVLSWNIHTAVDGDGQIVLGEVLDAIEEQAPDVVVLQEVGRGWPIAGQSDDLEWLARHLDMEHVWAPAADGQFGNAILSSHPIELDRMLQLPYGEGPQERSAVGATIGGDPSLFVVGVHLQHGDRPATRTEQIEAVIETWGDLDAWLMAGDLNMQPAEADASLLEKVGLSSVQDLFGDPDASTARDPLHPGDRVDWIWVTAETLEVSDFAIGRSEASDHLPLVVDVTP